MKCTIKFVAKVLLLNFLVYDFLNILSFFSFVLCISLYVFVCACLSVSCARILCWSKYIFMTVDTWFYNLFIYLQDLVIVDFTLHEKNIQSFNNAWIFLPLCSTQWTKTYVEFTERSQNITNVAVLWVVLHCMKSVRIQSYSGPHFPAFGLNTERYGVFLCIQSECGKMRTRKAPNTDTFYVVLFFLQ